MTSDYNIVISSFALWYSTVRMLTRVQGFWVWLIIVAVGLAYFLVVPGAFPFIGISLSLITFASVVMYAQTHPPLYLWIYYLICVLLSLFISLRSNPMLLFMNFMAVLVFGGLIVLRLAPKRDFADIIFSPFMALSHIFLSKPVRPWSSILASVGFKKSSFRSNHIAGLGAAIALLFITIPALTSANPVFAQWLKRLIPSLNEDAIAWLVRAGVTVLLFWFIPKLMRASTQVSHKTLSSSPAFISWWIPQMVIAVVLSVFFISQWQFYLLNDEELTAAGISHSERTREVFGQLIWVAMVTLALLWVERKSRYPLLTYLLLIEGLALTGFALLSDVEYIQAFGFTQKRLWGLALLLWLWSLYVLVVQKAPLWLMVSTTGFLLVIVNALNFDYLIAHALPPSTGQVVDYAYMSDLSFDAGILGTHITLIDQQIMTASKTQLHEEFSYPIYNNTNAAQYLQDKYNSFDLRRFNLGEYRSYLQVKDMNLEKYRQRLEHKMNELD
jgi:hypothetical protein